ncbi:MULTISPECIES: hypothetical protein [Vibrio]|uniref:hypothetical protein n=1 Tax=Vibrio TaxID=662 RepID=UPI001F3CC1DA|nr:hypothetical protein [Vibrio sp. A1-1]MCF7456267.1 hypothetical protein [Vibrio sp. A1-1]
MTTNTNQKHPIAKLVNVITILIVVVGMTMATARFFSSTWRQKAYGISVNEQSDWKVKYYWDMDLENPNGW